jgi:hypothetical protein
VELKVIDTTVRLDQLTAEVRALPGLSRVQGLSACGPSPEGETTILAHVEGEALTAEEERSVAEAVAKHVPDPQWGLSSEEVGLATLLDSKEGSLTLQDIESGLRMLASLVMGERPDATTAFPASQGSD